MPNLNLTVIPLEHICYLEDDYFLDNLNGDHVHRIKVHFKDKREPYIAIKQEALDIYNKFTKHLDRTPNTQSKEISSLINDI